MNTNFPVVSPAYGQDYKSKATAEADFRAGKDFVNEPGGTYCSIRDFAKGTEVEVRYNQKRSLVMVTI